MPSIPKMMLYAEILRQIGKIPNEYGDEPGHHYESPEYEAFEEAGAEMLLGDEADAVRKQGM